MKLRLLSSLICILSAILVFSFIFAKYANSADKTVIQAIQQVPNAPSGLVITVIDRSDPNCPMYPYTYWWAEDKVCRSFPQPADWPSGPNLFNPDNWQITYGVRGTCNMVLRGNAYLEMMKTADGWPPCGVMQKFPSYAGEKFWFAANVIRNTHRSEVYTDFDNSLFKEGTGTRVDLLTSKWADMVVWLQTNTPDPNRLPVTTIWQNVVIKRIE